MITMFFCGRSEFEICSFEMEDVPSSPPLRERELPGASFFKKFVFVTLSFKIRDSCHAKEMMEILNI